MQHKDTFILEDILDYCNKIEATVERFGGSNYDKFLDDLDFQNSCSFEIFQIGELANSLSENFKKQHPEVEWRKIIGMRNIIAHDYADANLKIVWKVIKNRIPELKTFCKKIIN